MDLEKEGKEGETAEEEDPMAKKSMLKTVLAKLREEEREWLQLRQEIQDGKHGVLCR